MTDTVQIVEMGARDGLQNEKTPVSPAERIAFIKKLLDAGLSTIEVGAFVSPRAIPQMVGSTRCCGPFAISPASSMCWCRTKRATRPPAPAAPG